MSKTTHRRWICDRCGKVKDVPDSEVIQPDGWTKVEIDGHLTDIASWEGHLCKKCSRKHSKWFRW